MTIPETSMPRTDIPVRPRSSAALLAGAFGFVLLYFSTDFVVPNLASSALPLPNDPVEEARDWFAGNQLATVMNAVAQFASVSSLAVFVTAWRRTVGSERAARASRWGLAAVAAMMLSSLFGWLLAAMAPTATLDTVSTLRTANFVAGGTAHVLALGMFVVLASRTPGTTRPVRVLGYVAVVPSVLSLLSVVVFEGAAFILLGRLLCMAWTVSAAVSLFRPSRAGSVEPSEDL